MRYLDLGVVGLFWVFFLIFFLETSVDNECGRNIAIIITQKEA